MSRFLLIDHDRAATEQLGLECLRREVGVVLAENVCEGVRALLATSLSLIVVDAGALRLTPSEHVALFERVAPGVPVVVAVRPGTPLAARVALELAGFHVLTRPVTVEDLLDKIAALSEEVVAR